MFDPCAILKHNKHKTPDAEIGENRSLRRQIQRGVEDILRWCESSSAEQSTVYTRLAAMTQISHRIRKNISQGSIATYITPKELWKGKKYPSKNSPFNYVRPMCYSQTSKAKNAWYRDRREQVIPTSTPKRKGTCFTMVWIIECIATDSLHKTCGNDTRLPSKQKKKYLTRKHWTLQHATTTANRERNWTKKSPFSYVRPMCYSQTSQAKNARCRDRREQVVSTSTPKGSGTYSTMVWMIECRETDRLHKTCGNDTSLPLKQKKSSHKEAVDLKTSRNNCKPETDRQQNITSQWSSTHVLFSNMTSIKR